MFRKNRQKEAEDTKGTERFYRMIFHVYFLSLYYFNRWGIVWGYFERLHYVLHSTLASYFEIEIAIMQAAERACMYLVIIFKKHVQKFHLYIYNSLQYINHM